MQKPLYELNNPKQTIEDQGYTLYPFFERNIRLSNNVINNHPLKWAVCLTPLKWVNQIVID